MNNQQESPSPRLNRPSESMGFDWPAEPIHASSLAEIERIRIFREAFLSLLMQDPRVIMRLDQWGQATGLMDAAQVMAAAVDEKTVQQGMRVIDCALERLDTIVEDIAIFVGDELHVPYAGVATALWKELCERAYAVIYGDATPPTHNLQVYISDPLTPRFRLKSFQAKTGETESEIVQRFEQHINEEYARLLSLCEVQGHVEMGRMRTKEVPTYAQWFYRHHVCQESIRSLAQQHHDEKEHPKDFAICDCRSTVAEAIKQAKTLMNLAFPTS